jgi:CRISPR-associated endonuclease/helicase Cas3
VTLTVAAFEDFFRAVNDGNRPFAWQRRLLSILVDTGRWPDVIAAPTGSGKSSVVDVHVFANALAAVGAGPRVPRRLSVVVNRRALVDSHQDRALRIRDALLGARDGIPGVVAEALCLLTKGSAPLLVTSIRGGIATDSSWIDDPRVTAVICATPDMWGSRLLFRGYGTARFARPREAGLLGLDSVMVLDEAHLNRQLLHTARDVARLIAGAEPDGLGAVPGLQVVATTATPDPAGAASTISVDRTDLDDPEEPLARRLRTRKLVRLVSSNDAPTKGSATSRYTDLLAEQALEVAADADTSTGLPSTVLCVVNHVQTAAHLAEKLTRRVGPERVQCWVGRMRPMDLDRLRATRPGLFTTEGDDQVAFLVATQTVEVGIDLDCAGMVTELAPGSALAQRFGRVNRRGLRSFAEIRVVGPEGAITADRPPYAATDLTAALDWLRALGEAGDVSPWALATAPPPAERPRRRVLSDLYAEHAELLAATSEELFHEPDLDFWLRDDLDPERDPAGFVIRAPLPEDDNVALALLRATPPADREVFPATVRDANEILGAVLAAPAHARAFRWRAGDCLQLVPGDRAAPGDQIVVDAGHSLTRMGVIVPNPPARAESHPTAWGDPEVEVVLEGEDEAPSARRALLNELAGLTPEEAQERYEALIDDAGDRAHQVVLPPQGTDDSGALPWLVLRKSTAVAVDPEARQQWSPRRDAGIVTLAAHQEAVASRAEQYARALGLPASTVETLRLGGRHHDDGKAHPEFQAVLRGDRGGSGVLLAKSTGRSAQQAQRRRSRVGWRHEQLSAVHAWSMLPPGPVRDLTARLAGTSHGRGRPFFPMGADSLLAGLDDAELRAAAEELFATGAGWSDVLDRTDARLGAWGTAYLEAVLRAADCQVSREGS